MHFCQKLASCLLAYRGATRGSQFSGLQITMGAPDDCRGRRKLPTVSQIFSSVECICFQKTSGSNMGAPNLLLALGPIYTHYTPADVQMLL